MPKVTKDKLKCKLQKLGKVCTVEPQGDEYSLERFENAVVLQFKSPAEMQQAVDKVLSSTTGMKFINSKTEF